MLNPDFDSQPVAVRIHLIGYVSKCKVRRCVARATVVAEKGDGAGRQFGKSSCAIKSSTERLARVLKKRAGRRTPNARSYARVPEIQSAGLALKRERASAQRRGLYASPA